MTVPMLNAASVYRRHANRLAVYVILVTALVFYAGIVVGERRTAERLRATINQLEAETLRLIQTNQRLRTHWQRYYLPQTRGVSW